jgi:anti-anti-sigma factor
MDERKEESAELVVETNTLPNFVVVTPRGCLTYANSMRLARTLETAGAGPRPGVIIDCEGLELMDSAALELLQKTHTDLTSRGGTLRLAALNRVCSDIMTATRLVNLFHISATLDQAISGNVL